MAIAEITDMKRALAPQSHRPLGSKIIRSVMFGAFRYMLIAPIPFLMTPLILHKVGVEAYGTWAIFVAINGLTSLTDLGLVGTLSKFVAEYHARQDFAALSRLLSSGLTLFLLLDIIVCSSLWGMSALLAGRLFRGSTVATAEIVFLLRCFLFVIAANILTQLFASVTTGLQRLDLTNLIGAANILMNAAFGAVLILKGLGLRGLVYGYICSAILTIAVYLVVVSILLPGVVVNPLRFNAIEARKMFGYSLRLYITQAAVAVHNQVEKVFLATLVGVAPVGWYDIASDAALKVRGALGFILAPVLPAASELHTLGDEARMEQLYCRTHKYLAVCGVPTVFGAAALAPRFVELWIGSSLRFISFPLSVLLAVNFLNLASGPGFLILAGRGDMKPGIRSATLGIVLNVVLSLALIYKFGFAGAVWGTSISLSIASGYFIFAFHNLTRYSLAHILQESYLKPACCSVIILGAMLSVASVKNASWVELGETVLVFGFLYAIAILLCGFFDDYDWRKIEGFLPLARHVRRISLLA